MTRSGYAPSSVLLVTENSRVEPFLEEIISDSAEREKVLSDLVTVLKRVTEENGKKEVSEADTSRLVNENDVFVHSDRKVQTELVMKMKEKRKKPAEKKQLSEAEVLNEWEDNDRSIDTIFLPRSRGPIGRSRNIDLKRVNITVNANELLAGATLRLHDGRHYGLVGRNGVGKSTLLRTIAGLEPIQGGTISINDQVIDAGKPGTERAGRSDRSSELRTRIGMVFQSYDLFPNKTVLGNITMAPVLVQKRDKSEVEAEAIRLLGRVGLADRKDSWPHELSGGQRQRVAICRALILHPEVLLLDEITAALDPEMVREVLDVVLELAKSGQTMLIVTHEMQFARAIADHIILLDGGRIVEESYDAQAFFEHPQTERAQQFLHTFEFE